MKYAPTESDRLTGLNVRSLRRKAGETMAETLERSGLDLKQSSLSRIELGQRALTLPEATKLAAHWDTTTDRIFVKPTALPVGFIKPAETEQQFLGNDPAPALFAVPETRLGEMRDQLLTKIGNSIVIKLDDPMTPEQYRLEVWVPYLEARYANEQKAS